MSDANRWGCSVPRRPVLLAMACALVVALAACGGGSEDSAQPPAPAKQAPVVKVELGAPSVTEDSNSLAQRCASGNSLAADLTYTSSAPPVTFTTLTDEKKWLWHHMNERYLWFDEMPALNAVTGVFADVRDMLGTMNRYLQAFKTPRTTTSGLPLDRFSIAVPTSTSSGFFEEGILVGHGLEFAVLSYSAPRDVRIASIHAASPAAALDVRRGDRVEAVNGIAIDTMSTSELDFINTALFAPLPQATYRIDLLRTDGSRRQITIATESYKENAVPLATTLTWQGKRFGYLVFNDHIASAEAALYDSIRGFQTQGIDEMVLDLRYNGGGYVSIASQLASMLAPADQRGKVFESLMFNSKRKTENQDVRLSDWLCVPASGSDICTRSDKLPSLALRTLYVLTTEATCSASESLINGLRGVGVNVVLIGGSTCGKPFGYTGRDNCGISYFTVEFAGVNAKGEGGYVDGLTALCPSSDDLTHALGDPAEAMLATALHHATTGACPSSTLRMKAMSLSMNRLNSKVAQPNSVLHRAPMRSLKIMRDAAQRSGN